MHPGMDQLDRIAGTLLGAAVGDALGLPREGLSRRRAERLYGSGPVCHRFLFRRGMVSDDTEHACMTAQALLAAPENSESFARSLAWRLRGWILGVPAGIGWGTLRAILKLWIGFSPERSGVASAGNGPAMRSPILGVCLGNDPEKLETYVGASTRLTHTDPRAHEGALVIALAAWLGAKHETGNVDSKAVLARLRGAIRNEELLQQLERVESHLRRDEPAEVLADGMGLAEGVTGYVCHTVPIALYCWLRSPTDFRRAVESVIRLGGDTDTTASIVGALAGASSGASGIPRDLLDGLFEWPRSVGWMRELSARLARRFGGEGSGESLGSVPLFWPGLVVRNLAFALIVLAHGFRRIFPPYG